MNHPAFTRSVLSLAIIAALVTAAHAGRLDRVLHPPTGAQRTTASPYDALWTDEFALPNVQGGVVAAVPWGGDVVLAGSVVYWGTSIANYVARWDGSHWQPLGDGLPAAANALVLYAGGIAAGTQMFTPALPGTPHAEVDFWNGSSWSSLGSANGWVTKLVAVGSDLYAAGSFTSIDGVAAAHVARWDGSSWHALGAGLPGSVTIKSLVAHGSLLVAGGSIPDYQGIAGWNGTNWSTIGAGLQRFGGPASVRSVASDGTTLYAYGGFNASGATPLTALAQWNGSAWTGLPVVGSVSSYPELTVFNGSLVAHVSTGGAYTLQRWTGSAWIDLGAPALRPLRYGSDASRLYVCAAESLPATGATVANMDAFYRFDGSTWTQFGEAWKPNMKGLTGAVYDIEAIGDSVYFGTFVGGYAGEGGAFRNVGSIVRWDGSRWLSTGLDKESIVNIVPWGNSIAAATPQQMIGRVGGVWKALGTFFLNWTYAGSFGADLLAFGPSQDNGGPGIARWDGTGWPLFHAGTSDPSPSGPNMGFAEISLEHGTDFFLAGLFDSLAGQDVRNLARWDGTSWNAVGGGTNGEIFTLAEFAGDVVAGGVFTEAGGVPVSAAARWNGVQWTPLGTNAIEVNRLRAHAGRLYAAGEFLNDAGQSVRGAAVLVNGRWVTLGSGVNGPGYAATLEFQGPDLFVGGSFNSFSGHVARGLARLPGADVLAVEPPPAGTSLALAPAPNPSRGLVRLSFTLPADGRARLTLHDLAGREVARLADGAFTAGAHTLSWSGHVAPGLYFARLQAAGATRTARIVRVQ